MRSPWTIRSERSWRIALAVLFALGVANGLFWINHKQERFYEGQDSFEYRLLATNLLDGHGYSREQRPPYRPTNYREPGYPAFIAAVFAVSDRSDQAVAFAQAVLVGGSAVLTALLGQAVFQRRAIALLGATFVALSPDLGDHARYEMSEALFVPLLLAATLLGFRAWRAQSVRRGAIAGIAFGLAAYVRVITFPTAILAVLASLVVDRFHGRRRWLWGPALVLCMLVMAGPWIVRNALAMGQPSFSGRSGAFILPRADKAALPLEEQIALYQTAFWAVTFPFSALVVPTEQLHTPPNLWDGPLGDLELQETNRGFARHCQDPPLPTVEMQDACNFREGTRIALSHPLQYVYMTPLEFARLTFYVYPSKLSVIRNWMVWVGLATLAVCLLPRSRRTPERTWLALMMLSYTLTSIAGDTQPRYGVPLVPFYALFAAAGAIWVGERLLVRLPAGTFSRRPRLAPADVSGPR